MLVVIQLWLVAAALDALLARQTRVLVPTAVASLVLFALSGGLLWYVVVVRRAAAPLEPAWLIARGAPGRSSFTSPRSRAASSRASSSRTC